MCNVGSRMIDPKLIQVYHVDEANCVKWSSDDQHGLTRHVAASLPSKSPKWHPSDWASKAAIAASLNTSTAFCGNVEKLACLFIDTKYSIYMHLYKYVQSCLKHLETKYIKCLGSLHGFPEVKPCHSDIVRGKTLGIIYKYNSEIRLYIKLLKNAVILTFCDLFKKLLLCHDFCLNSDATRGAGPVEAPQKVSMRWEFYNRIHDSSWPIMTHQREIWISTAKLLGIEDEFGQFPQIFLRNSVIPVWMKGQWWGWRHFVCATWQLMKYTTNNRSLVPLRYRG